MVNKINLNTIPSINPATNEVIGEVKLHSVDELREIVNNAKLAQSKWAKYSVKDRVKKILKIREYVIKNIDEIVQTIASENGKTMIDALSTEILSVVMAISYYCKNASKFLRDEKLSSGSILLVNKRSKIIRVPFGVIGIISPWNYPFTIPFSDIIMGLLTGNAVILKGASETVLTTKEIKNAISYAELPTNLFKVVNMPGRIAGDALLESGIDKLIFTGSVEVGKYLMSKAAKTLTPITLELGGNDPMIVCEDADPYRAAMGAIWAGFSNAGQSCAGIERIYLHEKIYHQFIEIFKEKIENLRVGTGNDFNADMGCMTTKSQIAIVNKHIDDAILKGAKILAQSRISDKLKSEHFIPATAIINVNHDMLLMKEESFGPIVGIMKFNNYDEAVSLANDSQYGLSASVWSKNKRRAEQIASQLKAGAIMINDHLMSHGLSETPWGGFKLSGIGRTHGKIGMLDKTQPIVIVHDKLSFTKRNIWWHPYSKQLYEGIKNLAYLLYHKNIMKRFTSLFRFVKVVPRIFIKE